MRILVVGEGKSEEQSLPIIVENLLDCETEITFDLVRNGRPVHGRGTRFYKRALGWIKSAQERNFDGVVFLIDEDGDSSRRTQMNGAQNDQRFGLPRACGVAIRTYDAWFLADEQALSTVLDQPIQRKPEPEEIDNPKRECEALCEQVSTIGGLSPLFERVAHIVDLDTIKERCPNGFRPFAERVEAMFAQRGTLES